MLWDFTALCYWVSSGRRVARQEQGDSALSCCLLCMLEAWKQMLCDPGQIAGPPRLQFAHLQDMGHEVES